MAPSIRTTRTTRSSRSKRCSCSTGSHVRMVDAVSIYEPLPPKQTNYTYDGSGVATKNRSIWNGRRIANNLYTGSIRSRHQCDSCTSCRTGEMASHPHHQYLQNQEDSSEHRTPYMFGIDCYGNVRGWQHSKTFDMTAARAEAAGITMIQV